MKKIGKARVEKLIDDGAVFVDMRDPVAFRDSHIKDAINLPLRNFVNHIMKLNRKTKIVIYGSSPSDTDVEQAGRYAEVLGFVDAVFASDYDTLAAEDGSNLESNRG